MATLQGQPIKNTYQALLKTDGNTNIDNTLQTITDGQGNATALALSDSELSLDGKITNGTTQATTNVWLNGGGTSGSYYIYNASTRTIYLNAYFGDYKEFIPTSLTAEFPDGSTVWFNHTELGWFSGSVESTSFYNGPASGNKITFITLTDDPTGGNSDVYNGYGLPLVVSSNKTYDALIAENASLSSPYNLTSGWYNTSSGAWGLIHGYSNFITNQSVYSHAEGYTTTNKGYASHTEGGFTVTDQSYTHAEGISTSAMFLGSHSEGISTKTLQRWSHAEGGYTTTKGYVSHAEGIFTIASGSINISLNSGVPQHAEGRYNIPDDASLLIVGNGTADGARANAFAVTTFGTNNTGSTIVTPYLSASLNFADDTAAATGGVPLGGFYRSGSFVMVRTV